MNEFEGGEENITVTEANRKKKDLFICERERGGGGRESEMDCEEMTGTDGEKQGKTSKEV